MNVHDLRLYVVVASVCGIIGLNATSIYKPLTVFYTQLCGDTWVGTWTSNITCSPDVPQYDVIRLGLALSEHSKRLNDYNSFQVSFITTIGPGPISDFDIAVNVQYPTSNAMRMTFFLIVIKSQTTKLYIDLVNLVWNPGTNIDNNAVGDRTSTQNIDLTLNTIFPLGTSGLVVVPFTTAYRVIAPLDLSSNPDSSKMLEYYLSATVSGTTAVVNLKAYTETRIKAFQGVLLVINQIEINLASSSFMNMSRLTVPYSMTVTPYNLTISGSQFGPQFNGKCIVGIQRIKWKGSDDYMYYFTDSSLGHWELYRPSLSAGATLSNGQLFCFGNSSMCGEGGGLIDTINGVCYSSADLCPLPSFDGWTSFDTCPHCADLICITCTPSNRSNCLQCGSGSTLSSGACTCLANHLPAYTAISTSASGQWKGQTSSHSSCTPNCTYFIPNCQHPNCTSTTFCTLCLSGYVPYYQSSTVQSCATCSQLIANCLDCTSQTVCTRCQDGFYVNATNKCETCSNPLAHCTNCTNSAVCTSCEAGYLVNPANNQCKCDPVINSLLYCFSCTIKTKCDACISLQYFLSSTDFYCHACSQIHPACLTCSSQNSCSTCQSPSYMVKTNPDSTKTCAPCSTFISNCTTCSSPTICTLCDYSYGLTSIKTCQKCDILVNMPGCESCLDSSTCLTCDTQTIMFQSICRYCKDHIIKCSKCQPDLTNTFLQCTQCDQGYYIQLNVISGEKQCKTCLNVVNNCKKCTQLTCSECVSPYLIGSDGTCSQCQLGFYRVGDSCTKLQGCQKSVILANGTQICISCVTSLNFVYNPILMKCVCQDGFKEFYQIGSLAQCLPVCGDGLVIPQFQDCDDKDTVNRDGCNEFCKKEQNFVCNMEQPSKCVLHANFNIFVFNYAYRVLGENKGILSFSILPKHEGLEGMNWAKLVKFNFPIDSVDPSSLKFAYSSETGELLVTVPYKEELQTSNLQTTLTFDPNFIVSQPSSFTLNSRLVGVNAPLIFEKESLLSTHKNINIISTMLIFFLLLQFYVGSYVHKMIGLETIQVIQSIYFVRMLVPAKETSILNSMNIIQYSASGYENAEILFGDLTSAENHSLGTVAPEFSQIALKKFFLLNVNFSMIPLVIAIVLYIVSLARKYNSRNIFMESKDLTQKDNYTKLRRSSQWVYDHFLFPYLMMFNLISFFHTILQLQSDMQSDSDRLQFLKNLSFGIHLMMSMASLGIYSYEILTSYGQYLKSKSSKQEQSAVSMIQKLQHDSNNLDCRNYRPLYVLIHLIYYQLLSISMVLSILIPNSLYNLQLTLSLIITYFIFICWYKPYHQSINIHNHLLKVYYGSLVIIVIFCYLFAKDYQLGQMTHIAAVYAVMVLLILIFIIGFVRIFVQKTFRKRLQQDSSLLSWDYITLQPDFLPKHSELSKRKPNRCFTLPQSKLQPLVANNSYSFQNQLIQYRQNSRLSSTGNFVSVKPILQDDSNPREISPQEQKLLINKIRYQMFKNSLNQPDIQQINGNPPFFPHQYFIQTLQNENQAEQAPNKKIHKKQHNSYQRALNEVKAKLKRQLIFEQSTNP